MTTPEGLFPPICDVGDLLIYYSTTKLLAKLKSLKLSPRVITGPGTTSVRFGGAAGASRRPYPRRVSWSDPAHSCVIIHHRYFPTRVVSSGYSAPRAPRSANIRHVMTHRASCALATPPSPLRFSPRDSSRARSRRSSPTRSVSPLLADSSSSAASSSLVRPPLQPLSSKECPSALRPHSARPHTPSSISPPYPSLYFCATR